MMIYLIIVLAIATRFIPHMPNFAPITALAIFSAAHLGWKKSVGLTLAVRLISDVFLGFFSWPLMLAVYASHLVGVLFGLWIKKSSNVIPKRYARNPLYYENQKLRDPSTRPDKSGLGRDDTKKRWLKIVGSSLGASVVFFLVTNFAFFYSQYSHNFAGIIQSYINGLPFFRGTALGDMGYTLALFGGYALAQSWMKSGQKILAAPKAR